MFTCSPYIVFLYDPSDESLQKPLIFSLRPNVDLDINFYNHIIYD
jgi:hypothetical protein